MPKVALTQAQKAKKDAEAYRRYIADGLCIAKRRDGLTLDKLADALGVSVPTARKILSEDFSVAVPLETALEILAVAKRYNEKSKRDGSVYNE